MSINNTLNQEDIKTNKTGTENGDEKVNDPSFECNICLDSPTDAVVSLCGHLFW